MFLPAPSNRLVATVLGAGTMGAQLAAHFANAGMRAFLLDRRVAEAGAPQSERNRLAATGVAMLGKLKPAPLMRADCSQRIEIGNFEDDLPRAAAASHIIVEAIVEDLTIKRQLFAKLADLAGPDTILASNTSGLSIAAIAAGLPEQARRRVVGLHFFNPPRYMHLLELIPTPDTDPEVIDSLLRFGDRTLGKGMVLCRDTPNFIGNRIGVAEMLLSFRAAEAGGYSVEEVDLLNGPLLGRPKTGSFRLADLVGLDILAHVVTNLRSALSGQRGASNFDELHEQMNVPTVLKTLVARKHLGDKTGAGFYRKVKTEGGESRIESLDLASLEYRARQEPQLTELTNLAKTPLDQRVAAALRLPGRAGEFLRAVYFPLFNYTANRIGEICDHPGQIDDAMRWGFGWQKGPFELWDAAGVGWTLEQMNAMAIEPAPAARALLHAQGPSASWYRRGKQREVFLPARSTFEPLPPPPGVIVLADRVAQGGELWSNPSCALVDLGDGIACLDFRSKMNVLDAKVIEGFRDALAWARQRGFGGLVIGNQGENFSVGADAKMILGLAKSGDHAAVAAAVEQFQSAMMALRHADIPVVAAVHGMTFGGGVECTLHCHAVQAHAELYLGLVEAGIGLLPAGGGLKEICRRASQWAEQAPDGDPYPWLRRGFEAVASAKVSTSALEARSLGYLQPGDRISFNKLRVIADAKAVCLGLVAAGHEPLDPEEPIRVVGQSQAASFMLGAQLFEWAGYASAHDKLIAQKIAFVLGGGSTPSPRTVTARYLLELEREAFVSLCGEPKTQARIEHLLQTGKPLRN